LDSRIRSNQIHVEVSHGWVTRTGYVRDESERAAAAEDVTTLTGVLGVFNRIEVR